MKKTILLNLFLICITVLAGCASQRPVNYQDLSSSAQLAPNPQDKKGHVPFLYAAETNDWSKYTDILLDPVAIYRGSDEQFGKTSETNKAILADYMQTQFAKVLKIKYVLTDAPSTNTMRVHLTLTGIETSTPVLSVIPKVVPAGIVFNSIETAFDKQAFFTGSVSFSAEIYDSMSGQLLRAYVTKQYPWAENVFASFGTLDATKAGIRNGAKALLEQLH